MEDFKTKAVEFVKAVWQQFVLALIAAVVTYVVLKYVVANLLDVKVLDFLLALVVGYLVYTRASLSKLKNTLAQMQTKVKKKVK
jgi:TRAP-type C4-dicarboxylate transport system permease large subunit